MKATPKSCSCRSCRQARKIYDQFEERSFRHRQNQMLRAGRYERITPALLGERNG